MQRLGTRCVVDEASVIWVDKRRFEELHALVGIRDASAGKLENFTPQRYCDRPLVESRHEVRNQRSRRACQYRIHPIQYLLLVPFIGVEPAGMKSGLADRLQRIVTQPLRKRLCHNPIRGPNPHDVLQ